jgi:tellurite resistance protein TehA-like permease
MAALTIATIAMYHQNHLDFFKYLALVLLVILSCVIGMLSFMTLGAIKNKKVCTED